VKKPFSKTSCFPRFIAQNYDVISAIGSGSSADIFKAHHKASGMLVTIKVGKTGKAGETEIDAEAQTLGNFCHPNIVKCWETSENCLVTEYCEYTLADVLRSRPAFPAMITCFARQLLTALAELSRCYVVHMDIKPQNILVTRNNVLKLPDFGLAVNLTSEARPFRAQVGTIPYAAPEVVDGRGIYDTKADIWSAGCVLFEMITGGMLFCGSSWLEQRRQIQQLCGHRVGLTNYLHNRIRPGFHPLVSLVAAMLELNPSDRISAEEALGHPALAENTEVKWMSTLPESARKTRCRSARKPSPIPATDEILLRVVPAAIS
jgi:serine/threonine protein kinase